MREGKAIKMLTYQDAKTAGEAAARWWAGVLQDPKLDNGDDSPMMALLINMSKNEIPGQPSEGLGRFTAILAEELNKRLAEADEYTTRYGISLGVDYGPDATLGDCAQRAGLRCGVTDWPWKTRMHVKSDEITVRYGYGAGEEIVWTKS